MRERFSGSIMAVAIAVATVILGFVAHASAQAAVASQTNASHDGFDGMNRGVEQSSQLPTRLMASAGLRQIEPRTRTLGQRKGANAPAGGGALVPQGDGTVYDAEQNVYWLADSNLAGNPEMRETLGAGLKINPDGSMDYPTALRWVQALNQKNYLGHNNWQLPVTPARDRTCSSFNVDNFGAGCTGSALGSLYAIGLGKTFPDSAVPDFSAAIGPFQNVQPSMYWTKDANVGGVVTFSFLSNLQAANTTKYNFMHVMATFPGAIAGQAPAGSGVVPYSNGSARGMAVYDATVPGGRTWILDANLARSNQFGIRGTTGISSRVNNQSLTVPLIDDVGAMRFETANDWISTLNMSNYAGASSWALPRYADLETLFADLKLSAHDSRLVYRGNVGPFRNLQPFFYWACEREQRGSSRSACDPALNPPPNPGGAPMAWSFNFDNGFEGTSLTSKSFYVMVCFPASTSPAPPGTFSVRPTGRGP
jgi:hypothetical protein